MRQATEAWSAQPVPSLTCTRKHPDPALLWLLRTHLTVLNQRLKTSGKILLLLGTFFFFFKWKLLLSPCHLTSPGYLCWPCPNCNCHFPQWLYMTGLRIYVEERREENSMAFPSGECWAGPACSIPYISDGHPFGAMGISKGSPPCNPTIAFQLLGCFSGLEDSLFCHRRLTYRSWRPT